MGTAREPSVPGRLFRWLMVLVDTWVMALLIAMTLLVTVAVFYRYVLEASLIWYDEFASYLLVWLTFYGGVAAAYHRCASCCSRGSWSTTGGSWRGRSGPRRRSPWSGCAWAGSTASCRSAGASCS
ncbi:MAG: TRAP transporter small permease subunit [candidate division NC10 bacterium]|nr:TRAP transporter small permease subunit [candidate division NC10 bacterium]